MSDQVTITGQRCVDVTVVVPFYKRAKSFRRLLLGVAAQSAVPLSLVVVDNGSPPEEILACSSIAAEYALPFEVRFVSTVAKGNANIARNCGMRIATSRYVAFLDSDDWWEPDHLLRSMDALLASSRSGVYSGARVHDSGVAVRVSASVDDAGGNPFAVLFSMPGGMAQSSSFILDRSKLNGVEWDEQLLRHQDFDLFLQVHHAAQGWAFNAEPLVNLDRTDAVAGRRFDFDSMLAFLEKWRARFPERELKRYIATQIEICHIVGAERRYKDFYLREWCGAGASPVYARIWHSALRLSAKQLVKKFAKRLGIHTAIGVLRSRVRASLEWAFT